MAQNLIRSEFDIQDADHLLQGVVARMAGFVVIEGFNLGEKVPVVLDSYNFV